MAGYTVALPIKQTQPLLKIMKTNFYNALFISFIMTLAPCSKSISNDLTEYRILALNDSGLK